MITRKRTRAATASTSTGTTATTINTNTTSTHDNITTKPQFKESNIDKNEASTGLPSKKYNEHQQRIMEMIRRRKMKESSANSETNRERRDKTEARSEKSLSKIRKRTRHRKERPAKDLKDPSDANDGKEGEKSPPTERRESEDEVSTKKRKKNDNSMERRLRHLRKRLSADRTVASEKKPDGGFNFSGSRETSSRLFDDEIVNFKRKNVTKEKEETNLNACSMDWEELKSNTAMDSENSPSKKERLIVVDTNILLSNLRTIQNVIDDNLKIEDYSVRFTIPWRVLNELEGLKKNDSSSSVAVSSRVASKFLYKNSSKILNQSLKDAESKMFDCQIPDDEILNCCLQLDSRNEKVALLSNDISLCNKAIANNIRTYTHDDFIKHLSPDLSVKNFDKSNTSFDLKNESDALSSNCESKTLPQIFNVLLTAVLKMEMETYYGDLWIKIVLLEPPWSITEAIKCIKKHWIAVFRENFPLIFLDKLDYLAKCIKDKISENELRKLMLELCDICCDLPAYNQIAINCKNEIIQYKPTSNDGPQSVEENLIPTTSSYQSFSDSDENKIIYSIEIIMEAFQAFCAQFSELIGVQHDLKQSDMKIPITTLISRANDVCSQLLRLSSTLQRTLSIFASNSTATEFEIKQILIDLKEIIISTARGLGHETDFNEKTVASFCILKRNVIEETYLKLSKFYELLIKCSEKCSNK